MIFKVALALLSITSVKGMRTYNETGGLVIMEMENTESNLDLWVQKNEIPGTGSGYLQFTGNNFQSGPARSPLKYTFKINTGGLYRLHLHCARFNQTINGEFRSDVSNDAYVRVEGDFEAGNNVGTTHGSDASLSVLKRNTKFFGGRPDLFDWASGNRLDLGGHNNKRVAVYNFKAGEVYNLYVSGRSKDFRINRLMFRRLSVNVGEAQNLANPESPLLGGGTTGAVDGSQLGVEIQAETFDGQNGVQVVGGSKVGFVQNGDWIRFDEVQVLGANFFSANASSATGGGSIELRSGSATGPLLGSLPVDGTGDWNVFETFETDLSEITALAELFLVFKGGSGFLLDLDSFQFEQKAPPTPPEVSLSFTGSTPDSNSSLSNGSSFEVEVAASGPVDHIELFRDGALVRRENVAPYQWGLAAQNDLLLTDLEAGTYFFLARASVTGGGTAEATFRVTIEEEAPPVPENGSPFSGSAQMLPGTIEAEDFNVGENGVAYFDTTVGNEGPDSYRDGTDVDLENRTGSVNGHNLGWLADGEWLNYAVDVTAGTYDIEVRVASNNASPGSLEIVLGQNSLGTVAVPNTGGWGSWQVLTLTEVSLSGGANQNCRFNILDGAGFNLDWVRFKASVPPVPQTVNVNPTDDTFLQNGNRVGGGLLRVQPSGPVREAYLKFEVTGVSGTTSQTQLELTVDGDAGSGTINVYRGLSNSWSEGNLSFSNAPERGALLGSISGAFAIGQPVQIDLGNSITGNGTESLIIVLEDGGNDVAFSSKEGSQSSRLRVTFQ